MLVPFLIMLREGIEAALIVGIIASYLKQTGRGQYMPAVWIGVFLAAALALLVGGGLELVSAEFPQKQQELFEGIVGLVAVGILSSMVFWMRKVARSIKHSLHESLDHALAGSKHQVTALIAMVFSPWPVKAWKPCSSCWPCSSKAKVRARRLAPCSA